MGFASLGHSPSLASGRINRPSSHVLQECPFFSVLFPVLQSFKEQGSLACLFRGCRPLRGFCPRPFSGCPKNGCRTSWLPIPRSSSHHVTYLDRCQQSVKNISYSPIISTSYKSCPFNQKFFRQVIYRDEPVVAPLSCMLHSPETKGDIGTCRFDINVNKLVSRKTRPSKSQKMTCVL